MKFSAAIVTAAVFAATAPSLVLAKHFKTKIHMSCPNVDWGQLTAEEEEYSAGVVQTTFNQVHQQTDGGDWYLDNIHWSSTADGMLGQSGSNYGGGASCRLCRPSYGAVAALTDSMSIDVGNAAALQLWEQAVHDSLKTGQFTAFHNIGACAITFKNGEDEEEMVDKKKSITEQHHQVEISANCQGVKWNTLSLEEEAFSAKAVMDSYNTVHKKLDGGDWKLDNVVWKNSGSMLRQSGSNYGGGSSCRLCRPRYTSASSFITTEMVQSAALAEWERELATAFQSGPYDSLKSTDTCKIQMTNVDAAEIAQD